MYKIIINLMNKLFAKIFIFFIRIYQFVLSPDKWIPSFWLKWKICLHTPHCSEYSIEVFQRYWFIPWIFMVMERISSCNPWNDRPYDPSHFKVVFLSSAPIGVPFLSNLKNDSRFDVVGVVTMQDKPVGRWLQIHENIIKTTAKSLRIDDIITPDSISPTKTDEWKQFVEWLQSKQPDFLVVIAYWKIIPKVILEIPKIAPINVHWSLLPKYRGASPIQSVFFNWETESGITIMLMNEKMDQWNMIKLLKYELPLDWTAKNLIEKIEQTWPKFLSDTIWDYWKWLVGSFPQDHNIATYCTKIEKENWLIDIYNDSLETVYNKFRAYFMWPKIYFLITQNWVSKRVIIENIKLDENKYQEHKSKPLILKNNTSNLSILELSVKLEWKKLTSFDEFKKGHKI